jgi:MoxR-like ATPase
MSDDYDEKDNNTPYVMSNNDEGDYHPEPDHHGYVHASTLKEDEHIFGDIAVTFLPDPYRVEVHSDFEDDSIKFEPPLKLWRRRQTLRSLILPKLQELNLEDFLTKNKDNIETIIPYELLPPEEDNASSTIAGNEDVDYRPKQIGLLTLGNPAELISKLEKVGCQCGPYNAIQISLILITPTVLVRSLLFEGNPGCGKSFTAKCLAKISGAEFMVLSCYSGMNFQSLIETPSSTGLVRAMASGGEVKDEQLISDGILTRAFKSSQTKPTILLVDEIDKVDEAIDSFFLGPLQDGCIYLENREPVKCNLDNLLVIFTKNFNRTLDDAMMRRVTPVQMEYLDTELEKRILKPHVLPQIANNIVYLCERMRAADGAYKFERPPAPDELLRAGRYVCKMLEWKITNFEHIGRSLFPIMAKSDRDRIVFEQFIRFHPEFADSLIPDPRKATPAQIFEKVGRIITKGVLEDPSAEKRKQAFQVEKVGWQHVGNPTEIIDKLAKVGYECMPYLAKQVCLLLNTKREMVKTFLLEGPPGCGKSYLAKALARIAGAEYIAVQCYQDMPTSLLVEYRNEVAIAQANAGKKIRKEDIITYGPLTRAFIKSQSQPVVLLIDEIDKVGVYLDTFFLGPIQDGRIWLMSGPAIDANLDNLILVFTKNFVRPINDALLRRVHPVTLTYLDSKLERRVLSPHCIPRLIDNLVYVADLMRYNQASFQFDRPPAPEELLMTARYILKLLEWGYDDPEDVGYQVWRMVAKSERDRSVLEHMFRHHPEFDDPRDGDAAHLTVGKIHSRLGKVLLRGIIRDTQATEEDFASYWDQK